MPTSSTGLPELIKTHTGPAPDKGKEREDEHRRKQHEAELRRRRLAAEREQKARAEEERKRQEAEAEARELEDLKWQFNNLKRLYTKLGVDVEGIRPSGSNPETWRRNILHLKRRKSERLAPLLCDMVATGIFRTYDTVINEYGVNPLGHVTRINGITIADFYNRPEVRATMYPTWQELYTEYPEYFAVTNPLFGAIMGLYLIAEQFTAAAKGAPTGPPPTVPTPGGDPPESEEELRARYADI